MVVKQGRFNKKYLLLALFILLAAAGIITALELTNTTHLLHAKDKVIMTANQETKGEPKTKSSSDSTASDDHTTQSQKDQAGDNQNGNLSLLAPSGNFVSNHRPNLSGSPAPNSINSVCTTTPGASCKIEFTKDSVTKSLPAQTTDSSGSTYWNWKLQDIDLTEGSWKIEAVSSLNGQSLRASDALNLEVRQ